MSDIFISYARATATQARAVAEALRGLGFDVWLDDELPAHRAYAEVIEERLAAAKAVVVVWSADAAKSEWVQSEADRARADHKLVQLTVDGARLPMPFDRIQCADLIGWSGDLSAPGWRKVAASIGDLVGGPQTTTVVAAAPLALPAKPSIAVMPFANLSSDPEQDYFADGMVVEITDALSRIKSIFVIASGSGLSFKGHALSPREVGRQLGVRYVLEGSVRKASNRVRISVQLVDVTDGSQLWTHRFEGTLEDVFALQDEVALAAAGVIEPTVFQAEVRRAGVRPTENMGAYDFYLRALGLFRANGRSAVLESVAAVHRAIELDPEFGLALSLAATIHWSIHSFGWSDDLQREARQSIDMVHRALKVAGDDAEVLAAAVGPILQFEDNIEAAAVLADRAVALNPGNARAWTYSGIVRSRSGDLDLAEEHLRTSVRLDPMGPSRTLRNMVMANVLFHLERFAEAAACAREVTRISDNNPSGYLTLAASLGYLGQLDGAQQALAGFARTSSRSIEAFIDSSAIASDPPRVKRLLGGVALAQGHRLPEPGEGAS